MCIERDPNESSVLCKLIQLIISKLWADSFRKYMCIELTWLFDGVNWYWRITVSTWNSFENSKRKNPNTSHRHYF